MTLLQRPEGVGAANWIDDPYNRWAFRNIRQVTRTAVIRRGPDVREFARADRSLVDVTWEFEGRQTSVAEMVAGTRTDALLVWHDGALVSEQYFDGMRPSDTHLLMSVSKSLTATLAGVLVNQGLIDTAAAVPDYIGRLRGTAWEGCTIQHLLDMRAGTQFDEDDYANPDSDGCLIEEVSDYVPRTRPDLPANTAAWIEQLPNIRPHGDRFQYRSILTDVLAWVIESVTGEHYAEAMSRHIWSRIGAEYDAEIIVDNAGFPLAEGGVCATPRDLLRFGVMMYEGGNGIVPAAWVDRLRVHDPELIAAYGTYAVAADPNACYHDMWWVTDAVAGHYQASGINGQTIRVDHSTKSVIVKLSVWPERWDDRLSAWGETGMDAIAQAL